MQYINQNRAYIKNIQETSTDTEKNNNVILKTRKTFKQAI